VSCGVIIYTLGDKAKNAIPQVVHVEGIPTIPLIAGRFVRKIVAGTGHPERSPLAEAAGAKAGRNGLGRYFLGAGLREIAQRVKKTRRYFY